MAEDCSAVKELEYKIIVPCRLWSQQKALFVQREPRQIHASFLSSGLIVSSAVLNTLSVVPAAVLFKRSISPEF